MQWDGALRVFGLEPVFLQYAKAPHTLNLLHAVLVCPHDLAIPKAGEDTKPLEPADHQIFLLSARQQCPLHLLRSEIGPCLALHSDTKLHTRHRVGWEMVLFVVVDGISEDRLEPL